MPGHHIEEDYHDAVSAHCLAQPDDAIEQVTGVSGGEITALILSPAFSHKTDAQNLQTAGAIKAHASLYILSHAG